MYFCIMYIVLPCVSARVVRAAPRRRHELMIHVRAYIRPYTDQLRSAADALTGWASTEHATAFNNGTCFPYSARTR